MASRAAALVVGFAAVTTLFAAPAQADPVDDSFVNALAEAGVGMADRTDAVALGQSVCPMLSEPGQNMADAASKVADVAGMPIGPATLFTGLAISTFCPGVVSSIGDGRLSIPFGLLGF